jgi:hypothetical protein
VKRGDLKAEFRRGVGGCAVDVHADADDVQSIGQDFNEDARHLFSARQHVVRPTDADILTGD